MKILSVIGPTAVGKTTFALDLASQILSSEKHNVAGVDLISVDSRQVYQGLEIVAGADVPPTFEQRQDSALSYPFFQAALVKLHGVSIIQPDEDWSLRHFQELALAVIELAENKQRLAILVGGTGFYHQHLFNQAAVLKVGPDQNIRNEAEAMSLAQLQAWAERVDVARFNCMNRSDRHNPRRLVRLIELASVNKNSLSRHESPQHEQFYIGLKQDLQTLETKIKQRVEFRLKQGAIAQVQKLVKTYAKKSLPALSALGVQEIGQYLSGDISREECAKLWVLHELQYAKRQFSWWKKKQLRWFEIDDLGWKESAFAYILQLYAQNL